MCFCRRAHLHESIDLTQRTRLPAVGNPTINYCIMKTVCQIQKLLEYPLNPYLPQFSRVNRHLELSVMKYMENIMEIYLLLSLFLFIS